MKRLSIRWRLTLVQSVIFTVIALVLIIALFGVIGTSEYNRFKTSVRDCAWVAESAYQTSGQIRDEDLGPNGCGSMIIVVLDRENNVLVQYGYVPEGEDTFPGPLPDRVVSSGTPEFNANQELPTLGGHYLQYAIPLDTSGAPDSPARVIMAMGSYREMGSELIFLLPVALAGVAILALVVMTIASWFMVRSSLAPVATMTQTANDISVSDPSRRIDVRNPRDELGKLATTFNSLLDRMETALRDREQALDEQRQFVADASHELRTPLTSILGYTRTLKAWGLDDRDVARESVRSLEQEAARMQTLVDALLLLARGDEKPVTHPERTDLAGIVRDAACSADKRSPQPGVGACVPDVPVPVTTDPVAMRQVLDILIDNALTHAASPTPIEVRLESSDEGAVVFVTDHGIGIAPEHQARIFDRFYRADASRTAPGSGLGLSIAHQVATNLGATLTVSSAPGEGTTFRLVLPVE